MYTITKEKLEQTLAHRINETEAEISALKAVAINQAHTTLTNRAVSSTDESVSVKVDDYIGIGKALYVYFQFRKDGVYMSNQKIDITAYTYDNPDGTEIGTNGIMRISRTVTPAELQTLVDQSIEYRTNSLNALKADLVNAGKIVAKYNKIANDLTALENSVTYATRGVMK